MMTSIGLKRPFIALLLYLIISSLSYAGTTLTITSGRGEPFVNPENNGFYDLIVKNMFQSINVKAKTVLLPSQRSLINANQGVDDGNIARIKGLEKKFPNLIRVPEKIIDFDFVAFTKNNNLKVKSWDDLIDYNVSYINGWKFFEKKVVKYKSLVKTKNAKQLFELVKNNRVDVALYDLWSGLWWINKNNKNISYLKPPIDSVKLYLYVNKKHKKLVPKLAAALEKMKKDGTYKKIYDRTLTKLLME